MEISVLQGVFFRRMSSKLPVIASDSFMSAPIIPGRLSEIPGRIVQSAESDSIPDGNAPSSIQHAIKSEICPLKLLDTVGKSKSFLSGISTENVADVLQSLFGLYKANKSTISCRQVTQHRVFEPLCRRLLRSAPSMQVGEVINALKVINYLEIPANSQITLSLLSLLRYQINDLSLKQMIYVDFLLDQLKPMPKIAEAIKSALSALFEIQAPIQFDASDLDECVDAFLFGLKVQALDGPLSIFAQHIAKNVESLPPNKLLALIITLSGAETFPACAFHLWKMLILQYTKNLGNVTPKDAAELVDDVTMRVSKSSHLYSKQVEVFLQKVVGRVLDEGDFQQAIYLQKHLRPIVSAFGKVHIPNAH